MIIAADLPSRQSCRVGGVVGFEEVREVAALAQLGDAQLDGAGAGVPAAAVVAIAKGEPIRGALTMGSAGVGPDLQLHQALGSEADHLAEQIGVRALSPSPPT